jgi:GxxExxY protein
MGAQEGSRLIDAPLTHSVIGCFYRVHRELGFGYREHIYTLALERELADAARRVGREPAFHRVICENRLKQRAGR